MLPAPTQTSGSANTGKSANALCFLLDDEIAFRRHLASELRLCGIDVVEFSNSARFADMVEDQDPDIIFLNLNIARPHEYIRALLALKECAYSGAVQIFGQADAAMLDSFKLIGADCSLKMLPAIRKPVKVANIQRVILDQRLASGTKSAAGISLSAALTKDWVQFLYQPKFDIKKNTIVGAEVVARVVHPEHGVFTPDQFLKGADEESLLKLSRLVLTKSLKTSAHLHQLGFPLQFAINISVDTLLRLPVGELALVYRPEQGDWSGIVLEIPERQVLNKIEALAAQWDRIKQSGISIAIDNFGRGASSLATLCRVQFSEIKIDQSLVQECDGKAGAGSICKSIIQIAHNFGSRATAVGISTEAQLRMLVSLACDFGQGYLLGKPMRFEEFNTTVKSLRAS
jgi:EAL domain-containing protein (putative c-di-GMP-specific phosphodiesterase class I)